MVLTAVVLLVGGAWFASRSGAGGEPTAKELIPVQAISHGHGLAVDPNDSSKVYIATHYGLLLLKDDKNLYQVGAKRDDYMGFSPHPTDSNTFFSSGHPSYGGNIGFQKSADGGFSWEKISDGLGGPVDFHAMVVSSVDPNIAYGWFRGDLQKTTDGGVSWSKTATEFPVVHLAADTKDAQVLYASSPLGLFKSIDGGTTWKQLFDGFVATSAVSPDGQSILSASEKNGLAESTDGGATWESIPENFSGETPLFISYYRQNPDLMYLLTQANSLYKSADGGHAWQRLPILAEHGE